MERKPKEPKTPFTGFASINEDLIQNILTRTPAPSFASAACVSKSWNQTCNQILSKPKLASAFSLNPDHKAALEEVFDKVLSEPIRPQFAIANVIGSEVDLSETLDFLAAKLGSKTPIIVSCANGILGRDAVTNEHKEVMLEDFWVDAASRNSGFGILLTVGFLPRLQGEKADQKPVMEKLDHAMSRETFIVGNERSQFLYRSGMDSRNMYGSDECFSDAVALVFARDQNKSSGVGEIQFHSALSSGVSAVGPRYKVVSVKETESDTGLNTLLTARREGEQETLGGQRIMDEINHELVNQTELFIGVSEQRQCFIGSEQPRMMKFLAFHEVKGGDGEHLFVNGDGISSGDYFHFYHSDPNSALSSCSNVSKNFRNLKLDWSFRSSQLHAGEDAYNVGYKEVVGGLVFSCWGRGESFFGHSNVDSSPFLDNFPGIPLAGIFCYGEIGRGFSMLNADDQGQEEKSKYCCLHYHIEQILFATYPLWPGKNLSALAVESTSIKTS
ncbi:unnamed protein product [Dovyalis caffra]|uniref:FIST C-domain domain-containing protein n=1 Tax=Dovyalis caffra TaxID=77055 RepID=A0AAV1SL74_9ROSI|nr:unnamed protein product [Dovyalis caffra]